MMILKSSQAQRLNSRTSLSQDKVQEYKSIPQSTGRQNELRVVQVIQSLLDIDDVWCAATGSLLDSNYKVDVVVSIRDQAYALQVKSTKEQRDAFLSMHKDGISIEGRVYPCPMVVVALNNLSICKQVLKTELVAYAKPGLLETLDLINRAKDKKLPVKVLKPTVVRFLSILGFQAKNGLVEF